MYALRMIGLFAIAALTMSSLYVAQTMAQPRLQQHKAADQSRSGVNCDWNMGACDMLQAYVQMGGKDPMCRSILDRAVELERQQIALAKQGDNSFQGIEELAKLGQQRDVLLKSLPTNCFANLGKAEDPRKYAYNNDPSGANRYLITDRQFQKIWAFDGNKEFDNVIWTLDQTRAPDVIQIRPGVYQARGWYTAGRNRRTFFGSLIQ